MKIGFIGLGKMGKNIVLRLMENGIEVVVWNRSRLPVIEAEKSGAISADNVAGLVGQLPGPKIIWLMLPAGVVTENTIRELSGLLNPGDLIIDGANSYFEDSIRHYKDLQKMGIRFLDFGVSGGPEGARNGSCLMIGGDLPDYNSLISLVRAAAAPDAYGLVGPAGAGHFAKMVHNGIEYGMMESIAEGAAVLKASDYKFNLAEVFRIYDNRSVIASRLTGWTREALTENPDLTNVVSDIDHTGEGEWTVNIAAKMQIGIPAIKSAVDVRLQSGITPPNFRNKVISALRGKFGQHKITEK
jgi:6-phosphogluconate dehydrogenase